MKVLFKDFTGDRSKKIQAIKSIRELTGLDLPTAKHLCDNLFEGRITEYRIPKDTPLSVFQSHGFVVEITEHTEHITPAMLKEIKLVIIKLIDNGDYAQVKDWISLVEKS